MVIIIHILTVLFAIASFIIIKKKRYKVMPLISLIIFISFIGFVIISILSLVVPYGGTLIYPLGSIILGLIFILVGFNDFYSLIRCKEKIDGVYCGYNTYYGGNGISTQSPVFEYTYKGIHYREQTAQNVSYKQLNRNMTEGSVYCLYIDPKHPAVFIFSRKINVSAVIGILFGIFFLTAGIAMLLTFLPVFWSVIR